MTAVEQGPRLAAGMDPDARRAAAAQALADFCGADAVEAWVRVRRSLYTFSFRNTMLLAAQAQDRGVLPRDVQSKGRWRKLGYHPSYSGLDPEWCCPFYVWVFKTWRRKDGSWTCCGQKLWKPEKCPSCGRPDHWFAVGPEYAAQQVVNADGHRPPLPPAPQPLEGNSHEQLIGPLMDWALTTLEGVEQIKFDALGDAGGYYDPVKKVVCVNKDRAPNHQVKTLIHEFCHAMGVGYEQYTRGQAELIVESAAMLACASLGLQTGGYSLAYVAGWAGGDGESPADVLAQHLAVIDELARRIEKAVPENH